MTADKSTSVWRTAIPWLWLAMSLLWAVVIIVTDRLAWPLALWIATTVGPLTYLSNTNPGHKARAQKDLTDDR